MVVPTGPPAKVSNFLNSGASDVSPDGTPSQFLLLRGLEPSVTEELLAKGAAKLIKPSKKSSPPPSSKKGNAKVASTTGDTNLGAKEGSLRRVLLIRSRRNNESWRYGFAEFATIEDAQAALVRYSSFEKFTIASKPVNADYVHAGIFVPVLNSNPETLHFTFSPLGNNAMKLMYWDEEAWVSELTVSEAQDGSTNGSHGQTINTTDTASETAEGEGLIKSVIESDAKSKKRKSDAKAADKQKKVCHRSLFYDPEALITLQRLLQHIYSFGAIDTLSSTALSRTALPQIKPKKMPTMGISGEMVKTTTTQLRPVKLSQTLRSIAATFARVSSSRRPRPTNMSA